MHREHIQCLHARLPLPTYFLALLLRQRHDSELGTCEEHLVRGFTYCDLSGGNRLTSCSWVAERLISGQGASSSADPAADVSLAGTFVSLLRQQNKQRAVMVRQRKLTQRPMPDDDDDGQLSTDCARCAHLCYLTMVVSQVPVGHPRPTVE